MDYEAIKAVILARLKQWQETQAEPQSKAITYPGVESAQIAGVFVREVLQDLQQAYQARRTA